MRSAMSDFIETNDFTKFSLDLNLEGRRLLYFLSSEKTSAILDFWIPSRDFLPVLSNPKISQTGGKYGLQGRHRQTTFHITRSQTDVRRIVFIVFVIMGITIKGEEVFDITICANPPGPPACDISMNSKRSNECDPQLYMKLMFSSKQFILWNLSF